MVTALTPLRNPAKKPTPLSVDDHGGTQAFRLGMKLVALDLGCQQVAGEARPPITPDGAGEGIRTLDVLLGKQAPMGSSPPASR